MEKAKLIESAKVYFEHNDSLQQIHVSEDGHFFYQEGTVIQYCKGKIQHFLLTRDEVLGGAKQKSNKEILQDKAKELEIEGWDTLSVAKLKVAIDEKEIALAARKELVDDAILLNIEGYEDLSNDELKDLIDKTKEEATEAKDELDKRNALIEEAKTLELEDFEELSNEELETKISEAKSLKVKVDRKAELEAKAGDMTEDEEVEYNDLVAELED